MELLRDLRLSLRDLRRRPAFAIAAISTLALGIGANVLVFALVEGVLLRPLPYRDPDRLVEVWNSWEQEPRASLALPELRAYGETRSLRALAGWSQGAFNLAAGGDAERVTGAYATAEIFAVLGAEPILGRGFTADDDRPGAPPVAVLGREVWERRFGADPSLVGSSIRLDGVETTVIGILPAGVRLPSDHQSGARTEVWAPLHPVVSPELVEHWGMHFLDAAARLDDGAPLEQAQSEIDVVVSRLVASGVAAGNAVAMDGFRVLLRPAHDEVVGPARRSLTVLLGAVALVLAIACANVANLELARAHGRRREAALRAALGASRGRLMRQLLVSSALYALIGGAAGVALAAAGLRLVVAAAPPGIPRLADVTLDGSILVFALGVSAVTAVAFGLLPALRASRGDLATTLRAAGGGGFERTDARWRRPLIAAEVAVAVVLVTGAGLLARTLLNLRGVDAGYRVDSILTIEVAPPATAYPEVAQRADLFRRLRQQVAALPGVSSAGAVSHLPLGAERGDWNFYPEDRVIGPDDPKPRGDWQVLTPGYLETLGIPLLEGRALTDGDDARAPLVLLVNQSLARRYWPDVSPVGRRVRLGGNDANPFATIVGVVGDVRSEALDREPVPELYLPYAQAPALMGQPTSGELALTVRTVGDPTVVASAVRDVVKRIDPELPLGGVQTLEEVRSRSLSLARFATFALGGFAALAAALGAVGIYGVISFLSAGRRREIGIRMALGAARPGIVAMVVGQGMRPALYGVAIGLAGALGLTRMLDTLLYEVTPADPVTYAAVVVFFLVVAVAACWVPARRASAVDPSAVLRAE
jgi:predicted permease